MSAKSVGCTLFVAAVIVVGPECKQKYEWIEISTARESEKKEEEASLFNVKRVFLLFCLNFNFQESF